MIYRQFFKRIFDFCTAFLILVVTSPVWFVLVIVLAFTHRGSPLFFQKRPGKNEKIFTIIKFKTMNDKRDPKGELLPDENRITKTGAFVRKLSLDELPQMLNVLKGEMSLIGPRPLLIEYLPLYNDQQKRRHEVRPGITGWSQVNGRNAMDWEKRLAYDVWYVDHFSLVLDLKILLLTFVKVFKSEGISSDTAVTMEKFTGNTP